jgi:type II secretory pathway pseudopilin PulG
MLKKGAMFGLDARIALAIFGALSVISGAALYSAIKESKMVALINQMDEYGKAYYAYYLDTGSELGLVDSSSNTWDVTPVPLVEEPSGVNGWKGPYLAREVHSNGVTLEEPRYNYMFFMRATNDTWDGHTSGLPTSTCEISANANKPCYVWVAIEDRNNMKSLATQLDIYVDGSSTPDTGKVRVVEDHYVMMQVGISHINN